jgi:hypothetical protein
MPTIPHIPIHVLGDNYPTSIAKTLMDGCTNPDLHEFARREGFDFDPAKVTVAFMPQLPFPCSTITEHPNQPGVDLVDIYAPFDGPTLRESNYMTWKESINYLDGKPDMKVRRFPKEMPPSLTMPSWVREAGVLDHNTTAYQWEGACRGEHPHWLLQIREFAQKRSADFRFPTPDFLEHTRFFGVTPKEGITLIYVSVRHRSHFKFFEQPSPDIPYFLEVEWNNNTSPLQLEEQPNHMHGFQLRMLRSLSHQATRYTQIALRNPHGLVAVGGTDDRFGAFKTGDKVRITADGYVWKVTAV